jgi:hypothetical protein
MILEEATQIRQGTIDDKNFIFNSWLKDYRESLFTVHVPDSIYYKHHADLIQQLLGKSYVAVLCNPEDPTLIFGYVVYQPYNEHVIVHYLYVKGIYRQFGLATKLLASITDVKKKTIYTSHLTEPIFKFMMRKYKIIYSPYLLSELSSLPLDTTKGAK